MANKSISPESTLPFEISRYKVLTDDDQYRSLKRTFLAVGKGRRATLPSVLFDNRLVLQLLCLKEEASESWRKVQEWFVSVRPDTPPNRVRYTVEKTVKLFEKTPDGDVPSFLETQLNLDAISPTLSAIGITRSTVSNPPLSVPHVSSICNRFVIDFHQHCSIDKCPRITMYHWIRLILKSDVSDSDISNAVAQVLKHRDKNVKHHKKNPEQYEDFLNSKFTIQKNQSTAIAEVRSTMQPITPDKSKIKPSTPKSKAKTPKIIDFDFENHKAEVQTLRALLSQLKQENSKMNDLTLEHEKLKAENKHLIQQSENIRSSERAKYEAKLRGKTQSIKSSFKSKCQKMRMHLTKDNKTNKATMAKLKAANGNLKHQVSSKNKVIRQLKAQMQNQQEQFQKQIFELQRESHSHAIGVEMKEKLKLREKNTYSDNIREVVISLQSECGVAAGNVAKTIQTVSEGLFDCKLDRTSLPCKQTAINMLGEGYVLSNLQVVENVLKSSNVTLHSDGTSRDQKKIVNHQLTLDNGTTFYLGFRPVACEDANTLLDITVKLFKSLSESFTELTNENHDEVYKSVLSKITSVMTDRAAAMKLFDSKFEDFLKSEIGIDVRLHFLHCNAHSLLGLSSACEKALLGLEKEFIEANGRSLGRDQFPQFKRFSGESESSCKRLIRLACEILGPRGDQKNGCHQEWLAFCHNSCIPSFKGNRFNCFFEAAAMIIFHRQKIQQFFSSGVLGADRNSKIESVAFDMDDNVLISFVCAIALLFLKVTGPYWMIVTSQVSYAEFPTLVQSMVSFFEKWSVDPSDCLESVTSSVFGPSWSIESCSISAVESFLDVGDSVLIKKAIQLICSELKVVSDRQLSDFLDDGKFSQLSYSSLPDSLKHCPLTNLVGESAFGDVDYDFSKRRNACLYNRSAHHVVKRNKTLFYLKMKSLKQKSKMFRIARKQAPKLKREAIEVEKEVKNEIRQKFIENQQHQIQKQMKAISKNAEVSVNVRNHGGPCSNAEDVDNLIARLNSENKSKTFITEVVKNEIRYCKTFKQIKNLKFAPLNTMIESLKNVLEQENSSPTPPKRLRLSNFE